MGVSGSSGWSIDAWLARMYERDGRRYLRALYAGVVLGVLLGVAAAATAVPAHYLGASLEEYAIAVLALQVATAANLGLVAILLRRGFRALSAWAGGQRNEEVGAAASAAAFEVPRRVFALAVPGAFLVQIPTAVLGLMIPTDTLAAGLFAEVYFGGVFAAIFGGLVAYASLELGFRPLRASLDLDAAPQPGPVGLGARLLLALLTLPMLAGIFAGGLNVEQGSGSLWAVYGLAVAGAFAGAIILTALLASSVLGPIRDLIEGTRAVTAGALGTRVPVTSDDELAQLTGSFNEMTDELRTSRTRIVAASDDARRRVERDLHDGAQQHLVLLNLKLGLVRNAVENTAAAALVDDAKADLDDALSELRDLAHGIYPAVLTSDGLPGALAEAVEQAPIPASLVCDGAGRYPAELEAAVYFCCLEALQNAAKHAGPAATVQVRLAAGESSLAFEVADDGVGFDPAAVNGSAGLQNMADRIGALGGELRVSSEPGSGTTVAGTVPLSR